MASTNKTPHLELNQWVLDDPFLMADLNEDNAIIDEHLSDKAYCKLKEVTTQSSAAVVSLDVSDLDFTQYAYCELLVEPNAAFDILFFGPNCLPTDAANVTADVMVYNDNERWMTHESVQLNALRDTINMPRGYIMFIMGAGQLILQTDQSSYSVWKKSLNALTTINLSAGETYTSAGNFYTRQADIPAGVTIRFYGVKK